MPPRLIEHLDTHIGPADAHYLVYPGPIGAVHRIRPSADRPWTTIYTAGMSDRPLPSSDDERIELVVCCPAGWFADDHGGPVQTTRRDPGDWLIELVEWLMELPWRLDQPIGPGSLLLNGEPPEPWADATTACGVVLRAVNTLPSAAQQVLGDGPPIQLLGLILLYADELGYADAHGVDALLARLDEHEIDERVDPERRSVGASARATATDLD